MNKLAYVSLKEIDNKIKIHVQFPDNTEKYYRLDDMSSPKWFVLDIIEKVGKYAYMDSSSLNHPEDFGLDLDIINRFEYRAGAFYYEHKVEITKEQRKRL